MLSDISEQILVVTEWSWHGDGVVIAQVTKKSSHEKFPSTAKYSDRSRAEDASHTVSLDTEFRCISNPDEVVAPEERVKAYKVQL